jgi:virginiamycin B lyase
MAAPVFDGHFEVGRFGTNSKIVEGPDQNMWLAVEDGGKDVARITPSGQVTEFELEGVAAPTGIGVDPEGRIWVTQGGGVASFLPADPKGTSVATAIAAVEDPASIVAGPDGQMWVATAGNVVHFPPTNPAGAKSIPVAGLAPRDIDVAGPLLAVADAGENRVVTVTTSGEQKSYPLDGQSQGVAGSPEGQIGFSQQSNMPTQVGVITPPNAPVTSEVPAVDPFGVALGSDGAFWAARKGGAQRFTTGVESTFVGGAEERFFVRQIAAGPGNTIWITMNDPGKEDFEVGRISGLEPPAVPTGGGPAGSTPTAPQTKLTKRPRKKVRTKRRRAKVVFRFRSSKPGARFECALVRLRKGKKARKPRYRGCRSPKKLKLKPGRYRFRVRAVSGGLADPSPAKATFRVVRVR